MPKLNWKWFRTAVVYSASLSAILAMFTAASTGAPLSLLGLLFWTLSGAVFGAVGFLMGAILNTVGGGYWW